MKKFLTTVATAALIGCGTDQPEQMQAPVEIQRRLAVPVCEYVMQQGDDVERLFASEMGGDFAKYADTPKNRFFMHGGYNANQPVQFSFNQYEILRQLNRTDDRFWADDHFWQNPRLAAGETLNIPDMNLDGEIKGSSCYSTGLLKLHGSYNLLSGREEKMFKFNDHPIEHVVWYGVR